MTAKPDYAPQFHKALLIHDGVLADAGFAQALARIHGASLLDAADARTLLQHPANIACRQLRQPDGRPYFEAERDGRLKRHHVFVDPDYPDEPALAFDVVCALAFNKAAQRFVVLPERIDCGAEAAFLLAAGFECCEGGNALTLLYGDVKADGSAFLNGCTAGGRLRGEIAALWRNMAAHRLDARGTETLRHLMDDMTGRGPAHARGPDYRVGANWQGAPMGRPARFVL